MSAPEQHVYLETHTLSADQLLFYLGREMEEILVPARESRTGRTAKTLVKEGPLRMTLVAMREGVRMERHSVDGPASLHVLRGTLRVATDQGEVDIAEGSVLIFNRDVPHDVTALVESAFLITVCWEG